MADVAVAAGGGASEKQNGGEEVAEAAAVGVSAVSAKGAVAVAVGEKRGRGKTKAGRGQAVGASAASGQGEVAAAGEKKRGRGRQKAEGGTPAKTYCPGCRYNGKGNSRGAHLWVPPCTRTRQREAKEEAPRDAQEDS